jgi:DNA-binding NarL/FixJ family response regulator
VKVRDETRTQSTVSMPPRGPTEREQDVTQRVLHGNATAGIAERMPVSAQTVQQHLKSIFDKPGVRSCREPVGKVFCAHDEPRVRDNEQRALTGRSLRGGPMES